MHLVFHWLCIENVYGETEQNDQRSVLSTAQVITEHYAWNDNCSSTLSLMTVLIVKSDWWRFNIYTIFFLHGSEEITSLYMLRLRHFMIHYFSSEDLYYFIKDIWTHIICSFPSLLMWWYSINTSKTN